jgi:CubicO group peptidase (beta-lactamase class C family)
MNIINPEQAGFSGSRLNRINQLTESYIANGDLAGTTTLIARRGQVVHFASQGKMNLETDTAMRNDTIFRIYSMTKPVTAVAIMMLYERGAFDLTTPVSRFIPEFKNLQVYESGNAANYHTEQPEREMNIGDLLSHTSGLTYDYTSLNAVDELYRQVGLNTFKTDLSLADFVKKLAEMPLLFSPGSKWNYGVSIDVLGHIVEVISGKTLDVFFQEEIFTPLEMNDTGFFVPAEKLSRFAVNYIHHTSVPNDLKAHSPDKTLFAFTDPIAGQFIAPPTMFSGGGGLVSTAEDYLKFATMLLNKGRVGDKIFLSPKTITLMTTNYLPTELDEFRYNKMGAFMPGSGIGLGFSVTMDVARNKIIGNSGTFGWSGAANTYFFIDPKDEIIAIFLTQLFPFDLSSEMFRRFKIAVYQAMVD